MAGALTVPAPPAAPAARIVAALDGREDQITVLPVLSGAGPLALRRLRAGQRTGPAEVALVGAMAAPLGGDRIAVSVRVEAGARLRVTSVAATVSLPGPQPGPAWYDVELAVAAGAVLEWLPEPVVAAAGSHLLLTTRITLDAGARLRYREEQILGRRHDWTVHGVPGRLTSRLTVRQAGRLILDQQTDLGPGAPGWDGPAVLAGHRAAGQLLTVGLPCTAPSEECAALLALPGTDAHLLVAVAPDGLALRRLLTGPL
ncbi:urease accessory protein [Kitasatospora sp. MAA4]|uniref:urease accessory protein UreD n=1 Tax=Kitasatospora sp. MAA4 TaxID=3035093 RepID=UPI002474AF97|nr:urease accessory protein UreD [Kitasatospora sp. MAA4]MDH6132136.1 urease accessory protein [Kitasatospora sp. MAA4]